MVANELLQLGALDSAALIARGEVEAADLIEARIAVIRQHNPRLNALVAECFDAARAEAKAVDARRARGEPLPALAGVPITVKDSLDVAGLPSTSGLPARRVHRAMADCEAVAALRAAGAIVLGKGNVAQALIFAEADNPLHGRSNHPERGDRSPGGSSGGEAALVAIGGPSLALGTDIGGSGRIPAAFCGVASMKPTAGRLPDPQRLSVPIGQRAIVSQLAAFARGAADVEAMLRAMNPPHLVLPRAADVDVAKLRVGCYEDDGLFPASPGVRRAVREAAAALRAAGADVVPLRLPDPAETNELFYALLGADGARGLKRLLAGNPRDARVAQLLGLAALPQTLRQGLAALAGAAGQKHLSALLRVFGRRSVDEYWQLCERQIDHGARFTAALDGHVAGPIHLLLGPVAATPAFTHGATKDLGVPGVYTTLFNVLGWPAGVVPWGRVRAGEESDRNPGRDLAERAAARVEAGSAGLPLAVQVAARPWREHEALAAMLALERAAPAGGGSTPFRPVPPGPRP